MSSPRTSTGAYLLITNVPSKPSSSGAEIDLETQTWDVPFEVEDEDLMFDGKPLNLLYEENRCRAERHVGRTTCRGRSRSKK